MNFCRQHTLVYLISVYTLLNVYRGILTIESERVHLEMVPNKRVQWIFPILPNTYNQHAYNIHVHNNPYVHNEHSYNIHVHNNPIVHNQDQHFCQNCLWNFEKFASAKCTLAV